MRLLLALIVAFLISPVVAHAAEVQLGYNFYPSGGIQMSGKPIGQSLFDMRLNAPVRGFLAGAEVEAIQTGRGGQAYDRLSLHLGRSFTVAGVSLESGSILGYARGVNDVFGFIGSEVRAQYRFAWVEAKAWRSFAENASPLNAADLPHTETHRVEIRGGPELKLSNHLAVDGEVGQVFGTLHAHYAGIRLRYLTP